MAKTSYDDIKKFVSTRLFDPNIVLKNDPGFPRISVVIPSYNQGHFIEQTILSILNQDYPNTEIIIMDGGSTDGTLKVIEAYHEYIAYWVSQKDRGQFDAIIKGLDRASGEILAWQNADDVYLPGAFMNAMNILTGRPDVDLVFGNICILNDRSEVLRVAKYVPVTTEALFYFAAHVPSQSAFWTRRVYEKIKKSHGTLDADIHFCMEKYFFGLVTHAAKNVFYLREKMGGFRQQDESKTTTLSLSSRWRNEDLHITREFSQKGLIRPYSSRIKYKNWIRKYAWHLIYGDFGHLWYLLNQRWKWSYVDWQAKN